MSHPNGSLPELPKKRKREEAKIDSPVLDWFYKNYPKSVFVEVKIKGGKMKKHQKAALFEVQTNRKFKYKFPDVGRRTPGDGVVLQEAEGFKVTCDGKKCHAVSNEKEFDFIL